MKKLLDFHIQENKRHVNHADAVNTFDVQLGDILKLKKPMVLTASGATTGVLLPVDSVIQYPVSKITPNAIYFSNNKWIKVDPTAYIIVDSNTSFLRELGLTTSNMGSTLAAPVVKTVEVVKDGVNTVIETGKGIINSTGDFLSGLGDYFKWIVIVIVIIGIILIILKFKNNG